MRKLLNYVYSTYGVPIYITENVSARLASTADCQGWCTQGEDGVSLSEATADASRVSYFKGYLGAVQDAMADGVDVRSYYA